MSEVKKYRCESCGAALKLSDDKDIAVCEYCGSEYVVKKQEPPKQAARDSSQDHFAKPSHQPIQTAPPVRQIRKISAWPNFICLFILIMGIYLTTNITNPRIPIASKVLFTISNTVVIILLFINTRKKNEIFKQRVEKPQEQITPINPWSGFFVWLIYVVGYIISVLAAQDTITLSLLGVMTGFGGVLILPVFLTALQKARRLKEINDGGFL